MEILFLDNRIFMIYHGMLYTRNNLFFNEKTFLAMEIFIV